MGKRMINKTTSMLRSFIRRFGIDVVRYQKNYPLDFSDLSKEICDAVKPYTMTSSLRVNALVNAVQYVVKNNIEGALVECGVWRGGSTMAMALALKRLGIEDREIFLYDTFSGMTEPKDIDISRNGVAAYKKFSETRISEDSSNWCYSPLEEVKKNVFSTGYPINKFHFIKGKVEDTIPKDIPREIALLRLDTDWYESTKHELIHLFSLLKVNGVLIIDDYGDWQGARRAVDEYFYENNVPILLNRIDSTGRIAIKMR